MPVALIARKKMTYGGRNYAAGEPFNARDESDASILKRDQLAADAPIAEKVMEPERPAILTEGEAVIPLSRFVEAEPERPTSEVVVSENETAPSPAAVPEPLVVEHGSPLEPPKKRTYRRRDMRPDSE